MEENGTYRWAPPKEKKEPNWKKVKHTVLSVIVILVLLLLSPPATTPWTTSSRLWSPPLAG